MNKEWSELNKTMQMQIKSRNSFRDGIMTLLLLREKLIGQIIEFEKTLTKEQMCAIPFINAEGYHSKTIAYKIFSENSIKRFCGLLMDICGRWHYQKN